MSRPEQWFGAAAVELELPPGEVKRVVKAWFLEMEAAVRAGHTVLVPGHGTFRLSTIKPRRVRIPTGGWREVQQTSTVRFRAAAAAKRRLALNR